jgi:NADH-quinone oxidoreductase subunit G
MQVAMSRANIVVDGKAYSIEAPEGKNLLEACLSLGLDLPYFCWHPAMHSVGACRQCAVKVFKDEADTRGRIAMACMTAVTEGLRASIDDPDARAFRAGVIEWLMVNHPHDCPICDEGGECHLQDMTVMTGHVRRRYRFDKREHRSQDLGPFLAHEMNRCIQCYRCVRFYRDYAGGRDLDVQGWHDSVFFGRVEDGTLESPFSGNLCEVCPTGVFTDKTQAAHPTRKWDLRTSPSVCPHCGLGCSTLPAERYGELRRVRPRYNADVNGYFLCDRGRYGQAFADSELRLGSCLLKTAGAGQAPASRESALEAARSALSRAGAIGIGSPRASLETNFALRELVGAERFFLAVRDEEAALYARMRNVLEAAGRRAASPLEAELSDAVLVLGEDAWKSAPILGLRLRQASRNAPKAEAMRSKRIASWDDAALREASQERPGPFFVATPEPSGLDDCAQASYRASPDDIARLGYAIAGLIDSSISAPRELGGAPPEAASLATRVAAALGGAQRPLVVAGSSLGSVALIGAASAILAALLAVGKDARISLVFPAADSLGASMLASGGLESAQRALEAASPAVLIVAEADLARTAPANLARLVDKASSLIVLDHSQSATTRTADIVLPASSLLEGSGTFLSSEGRAQRFFALRKPKEPVQDSWRWLGELRGSVAAGTADSAGIAGARDLDGICEALASALPDLEAVGRAAPGAGFRLLGRRIPRGASRESGRTAIYANLDPREPDPLLDPDSALGYTMEGPRSAPPSLLPRYWAPGWNSDQAINKFQMEVGSLLKGGEIGARVFSAEADREALLATALVAAAQAKVTGRERGASTGEPGAFLVIPRLEAFGSEELSAMSPAIAARIPRPSLSLAPADAGELGLVEGSLVEISFLGGIEGRGEAEPLVLPVSIGGLPRGLTSLPWGLPGLPGAPLAAWAKLRIARGGGR